MTGLYFLPLLSGQPPLADSALKPMFGFQLVTIFEINAADCFWPMLRALLLRLLCRGIRPERALHQSLLAGAMHYTISSKFNCKYVG